MGTERNKLRGGVASLLKRAEPPVPANEEVALIPRAGRPPKDQPSQWNSRRDYRTSIVMDREQHIEIRRLANACGVTFKQAMFILLKEGLARYKSGELEIHTVNFPSESEESL